MRKYLARSRRWAAVASQRRFINDARANERARSLVELRVGGHDEIGHREIHDGVTQEFEALVGLDVVF
jgi:hypothetical protein